MTTCQGDNRDGKNIDLTIIKRLVPSDSNTVTNCMYCLEQEGFEFAH